MTAEAETSLPVPCFYCGVVLIKHIAITMLNRKNFLTRQHILPKRRGGKMTLENTRPCCFDCNSTLNYFDDCPGALAAMIAVGRDMGFGGRNSAAIGAARRLNFRPMAQRENEST